jgi:hypothetical protein
MTLLNKQWALSFNQSEIAGNNPAPLQQQIDDLEANLDRLIATHTHNGGQSPRINLNTDIIGLFETVSTAPTATPRDIYDQIKIYTKISWQNYVI